MSFQSVKPVPTVANLNPTKSRFTWVKAFSNRQNLIALAVLSCCVGILMGLQSQDVNIFTKEGLQQVMVPLCAWGPIVYIGVMAISVVISQIPGLPMAYAAGALWGTWLGGVYTVMGGFLGAMLAYYMGRTLGQSSLRAFSGKTLTFSTQKGHFFLGWLVFVSRLLPVVSFDLVSYGAGIAKLSMPIYAIATLLGMIPSVLLITYVGDAFTLSTSYVVAFWSIFGIIFLAGSWLMRRCSWFSLQSDDEPFDAFQH